MTEIPVWGQYACEGFGKLRSGIYREEQAGEERWALIGLDAKPKISETQDRKL